MVYSKTRVGISRKQCAQVDAAPGGSDLAFIGLGTETLLLLESALELAACALTAKWNIFRKIRVDVPEANAAKLSRPKGSGDVAQPDLCAATLVLF
jgi:hypothetical protein